jgi:hypothetical protein
MNKANLVVTFQLAGQAGQRVKTASRIKIDGRGALVLYGRNGATEEVSLGQLQNFQIRTLALTELSLAAG